MSCPAWCDEPDCDLPYGRHRWGFSIAASALPTRGSSTVAQLEAKERQWARDMPAYRSMRQQGLQPKSIDGAADLAARASTEMEIESGHLLPTKKQQQTARSVLEDMAG